MRSRLGPKPHLTASTQSNADTASSCRCPFAPNDFPPNKLRRQSHPLHIVWKLIALAAVLAGLAALFTWRRRRIELAFRRAIDRRPKAPNGVVVGAEGFVLERPGAPGVLLLHGAGDTPQTLRYLADELHRRGFHVSAPLLPGHGRDLDAFARVTAREIVGTARTTFDQLRANHEWVGLIGLSMGGAVAVQLAADTANLPALGL